MGRQDGPDGREVFRSPVATLVWWIWVLFAVGNLIDLAVQGRDRLSVIAACTLFVVTGIVYATARRPRIIADDEGLTIVNPLRDHHVGWPAVVGFDSTELLRVRCLWTNPDGTDSDMRAIYAWAAHSSRRRRLAEEMRAQRRSRGGAGARPRISGFGAPPVVDAPPPAPLGLDLDAVVSTLTDRAEQVKSEAAIRSEAAAVRAQRPVSSWNWPAIAAVVVPIVALLIAIFA